MDPSKPISIIMTLAIVAWSTGDGNLEVQITHKGLNQFLSRLRLWGAANVREEGAISDYSKAVRLAKVKLTDTKVKNVSIERFSLRFDPRGNAILSMEDADLDLKGIFSYRAFVLKDRGRVCWSGFVLTYVSSK